MPKIALVILCFSKHYRGLAGQFPVMAKGKKLQVEQLYKNQRQYMN
jgi:hypothetical protein